MTKHEYDYDIVVIGAGFSGTYAALELAKDGYKILLLEKGAKAIGSESTSFNQCYKLHSGVHYFGDPLTARKCLMDSFTCAKQWSQFLLGEPGSAPRRDRHYVMSNSVVSAEEAMNVAAMLRNDYKELISSSTGSRSDNQFFGDPDRFIQEVNPAEYVAQEMDFVKSDGTTEKSHVVLAFDVGEPQVDIYRIQKYLNEKLRSTENITPRFNCEVVDIKHDKDGLGYTVEVIDRNSSKEGITVKFTSKGIANCAWQNIEALDRKAGFGDSGSNDTRLLIRMKISLLVTLPPELVDMDTCIFSLGPYCSITNQNNGTAIITYEPVTNVGHYFQGEEPPQKVKMIDEKFNKGELSVDSELGQELVHGIIDGCAIYVPNMKKAIAKEVRMGYVKMYLGPNEKYSIYDPDSPIHRRREDGIVVQHQFISPCYISNSGMKMTYTQSNAEKVRQFMREEMTQRDDWEKIFDTPSLQAAASSEAMRIIAEKVNEMIQKMLSANNSPEVFLMLAKEGIIDKLFLEVAHAAIRYSDKDQQKVFAEETQASYKMATNGRGNARPIFFKGVDGQYMKVDDRILEKTESRTERAHV